MEERIQSNEGKDEDEERQLDDAWVKQKQTKDVQREKKEIKIEDWGGTGRRR